MSRDFEGTATSQLRFQEHVYTCLEQGIPFICSGDYLFSQVENAATFMEYIDPVARRLKIKGPSDKNDVPRYWYALPIAKFNQPEQDPPEQDPPAKLA